MGCDSVTCRYQIEICEPIQDDDNVKNNELVYTKKTKKVKQNAKENSYERLILTMVKPDNKLLEDKDKIDQVLSKHFIMHNLNKEQRLDFIKEISLCSIDKGKILFKEKYIGAFFYIIKSGVVELTIKSKPIKTFREWDSFGELALLHNAKRSGTVTALETTYLWCIDNKKLKSFLLEIKNRNYEEQQLFFNSIPILSIIDNKYKSMLCSYMIEERYEKGNIIINEGDPGNSIYIIKEGEADCFKVDNFVRTLSKGDFFGDKSILTKTARTLTIKAKTDMVLYCLSVALFKQVMSKNFRKYLMVNFIKYAFLSCDIEVETEMIKKIYYLFQLKDYQAGDVVFRKRYDKSSSLAIIIEGKLKDSETGQFVPITRGSIVFKEYVFPNKTGKQPQNNQSKAVTNNLIADPDCLLLIANIIELTSMFQMNLNAYFDRCKLICSLGKISLFKSFPIISIEHLVSIIKIERYNKNDLIIKEGDEGNKFFIIKEGQVDIYIKGTYIRTLNEYEYFGEKSLVIEEKRTATVKTKTDKLVVYSIDKENFNQIIKGDNMLQFLHHQIIFQDNNIELSDLETVSVLGKGSYGCVSLVRKKKNRQVYALKSIEKNLILYQNISENIGMEKTVMLQIDHPFIIKMVKTLKDEERVYFLLEYIEGQELFDVIRDIGLLSKTKAQFYICSLYLTIDYLHHRGIIHRDIKPENVMIRENGYIKLIDFGTAKAIKDKTDTIIGTPQYMAPEVILGQSYSFSSDYWSIAVCLYEFVCGEVPFAGLEEDLIKIYNSILNDEITFPSYVEDQEFKNLIQIMLNKKILKRYTSLDMIKSHPFFNDFDWDSLINMNMEIPYKPNLNDTVAKDRKNSQMESNISHYDGTTKGIISREQEMKFNEWYNDF